MSVTVIDSIMGAGKTSYGIQLMMEAPVNQKFIYITPFLTEVDRIKKALPERNFKEPNTKQGHGTKMKSFKKLVGSGDNIVTTHSLFAMVDQELKDLLEWENYILVIDEVQDVISQLKTIKKDDVKTMLLAGMVEIEEGTNKVIWKDSLDYNGKFNEVKQYALNGNLYAVNDTVFFWSFPAEVFSIFDHVYILTYMFDGQIQKYFYDYHGITYTKKSVIRDNDTFRLVDYYQEDRSLYKILINVYEGKLNEVGEKHFALSKKFFKSQHNAPKVTKLKHDLYNYLRNIQGAKGDEILWTTFKDYKVKLSGKGFAKSYIPFNTRATNEYKECSVLAFCLNRFMNPYEEKFFQQRSISVNEDLLALSDLLQWIFRSRIREGQPVELFIPSKRMRILLQKWLDGEM
jgi:hypothetical protein